MKRERIGLILGLALLVGISVFPIPGIPDEARRMLAVAAIMATWWVTEAAPLAVTSPPPAGAAPGVRDHERGRGGRPLRETTSCTCSSAGS